MSIFWTESWNEIDQCFRQNLSLYLTKHEKLHPDKIDSEKLMWKHPLHFTTKVFSCELQPECTPVTGF